MSDIRERLRNRCDRRYINALCEDAADEIDRLWAAGDAAFFAMCAYRDSPDKEVFQDAIDALGVQLSEDKGRRR